MALNRIRRQRPRKDTARPQTQHNTHAPEQPDLDLMEKGVTTANGILALQRTIGNQAVNRLIQRQVYDTRTTAKTGIYQTSSREGKLKKKLGGLIRLENLAANAPVTVDDDYTAVSKGKNFVWAESAGTEGWIRSDKIRPQNNAPTGNVMGMFGGNLFGGDNLEKPTEKFTLDNLRDKTEVDQSDLSNGIFAPTSPEMQLIKNAGVNTTGMKLQHVNSNLYGDMNTPLDQQVYFENFFGEDVWVIANVFRNAELCAFFMNQAIEAQIEMANLQDSSPRTLVIKSVVNEPLKNLFTAAFENGDVGKGETELNPDLLEQAMNTPLMKGCKRVLDTYELKVTKGTLSSYAGAGDSSFNLVFELESTAENVGEVLQMLPNNQD